MRRGLAVVGLALALTAGCSADGAGLSNDAGQRLQDQVSAVEYAIADGQYTEARQGLTEIRETTILLSERGEVGDGRATAILTALDNVDARLVRLDDED